MKKVAFLIVLAVIVYLIVQYTGDKNTDVAPSDTTCVGMSLSEAIDISQLGCWEEATLTEQAFCNSETKTRWIDVIPLEAKEGCNPACVVDVNSKATEINRRCTGLLAE